MNPTQSSRKCCVVTAFCLLAGIAGISPNILGQTQFPPIIEWQRMHGGSDKEYLHDVQVTTDGGIIAVGESFSGISGNKTIPKLSPDNGPAGRKTKAQRFNTGNKRPCRRVPSG